MRNNTHSLAFYQKKKDKISEELDLYLSLLERNKILLEEAILKNYEHTPEEASHAKLDLYKYASKTMSREEFIFRHSFILKDNYMYYTFIQYRNLYNMTEKKKKELETFLKLVKQLYPNGQLI